MTLSVRYPVSAFLLILASINTTSAQNATEASPDASTIAAPSSTEDGSGGQPERPIFDRDTDTSAENLQLSKELQLARDTIARLQDQLQRASGPPKAVPISYRISNDGRFESDTQVVYLVETSNWVKLSGKLVRKGSGGEFEGESSSRDAVNVKHVLRFKNLPSSNSFDLKIDMSMPGTTRVTSQIDKLTEGMLVATTHESLKDPTVIIRPIVSGDVRQNQATMRLRVAQPSYVSLRCLSRPTGARQGFTQCRDQFLFSSDRFQNPTNAQFFEQEGELTVDGLSPSTEYKFLPRVASAASGKIREYTEGEIETVYSTLPADFRSKGPLTLAVDQTGSLSLSTTIDSVDIKKVEASIRLGAATVNLADIPEDRHPIQRNCSQTDCTVTVTFPFEYYVGQFAEFLRASNGDPRRPVFSMVVTDSIGRPVAFDLSLAVSRPSTATARVNENVKAAMQSAAKLINEKRGVRLDWREWLELGMPILGALL